LYARRLADQIQQLLSTVAPTPDGDNGPHAVLTPEWRQWLEQRYGDKKKRRDVPLAVIRKVLLALGNAGQPMTAGELEDNLMDTKLPEYLVAMARSLGLLQNLRDGRGYSLTAIGREAARQLRAVGISW